MTLSRSLTDAADAHMARGLAEVPTPICCLM